MHHGSQGAPRHRAPWSWRRLRQTASAAAARRGSGGGRPPAGSAAPARRQQQLVGLLQGMRDLRSVALQRVVACPLVRTACRSCARCQNSALSWYRQSFAGTCNLSGGSCCMLSHKSGWVPHPDRRKSRHLRHCSLTGLHHKQAVPMMQSGPDCMTRKAFERRSCGRATGGYFSFSQSGHTFAAHAALSMSLMCASSCSRRRSTTYSAASRNMSTCWRSWPSV